MVPFAIAAIQEVLEGMTKQKMKRFGQSLACDIDKKCQEFIRLVSPEIEQILNDVMVLSSSCD